MRADEAGAEDAERAVLPDFRGHGREDVIEQRDGDISTTSVKLMPNRLVAVKNGRLHNTRQARVSGCVTYGPASPEEARIK